mgnify:CR=1 FL=1
MGLAAWFTRRWAWSTGVQFDPRRDRFDVPASAWPLLLMLGLRPLGHRNVLCCMRAAYTLLAAVLMTIAFAGALTPYIVLVVWGLQGLVRPSDLAVRQTLVAETMPPDQLMGGMGLTRTTSDLSRIGGALVGAGMFKAFGIGNAYLLVVACYLSGLLLTAWVRPRFAPNATTSSAGPGT